MHKSFGIVNSLRRKFAGSRWLASTSAFRWRSEELAQLVVETGNTKVTGKYLVEGYFAPSQLKAAIDRTRK